MSLTLEKIRAAQARIAPYTVKTPLLRLAALDDFFGCRVWAKAECMQITGAFKLRGAFNKVLQLSPEELSRGVVAASSGNHGRGLSYAAKALGIPVTIVIPYTAPKIKVDNILALGAEVTQCSVSERFEVAARIAREKGAVTVPPFNDEEIMAGQGTVALEILEQAPGIEKIVVPVSGGGLIGGIATGVKALRSEVEVWGAEPAAAPRYSVSLKEGKPTKVTVEKSVADALVANTPGDVCFPYVAKNTDGFAAVTDEAILRAHKKLLFEGKLLAEFSSAIGLGGVLEGKIPVRPDENVCFVISGGSIAPEQLDRLKDVD
ncbi:MAG: threonine/serine dehydratase [Lachnospiraceae bacterium]|nr:threonine/serine dehydratase [Lachnospiraceae bacterium]